RGFRRVEVERGGARRGQGGRDLLADQPALAHPADHHAPGAAEEDLDRAVVGLADALHQAEDGLGLRLEHLARGLAGHSGDVSAEEAGTVSGQARAAAWMASSRLSSRGSFERRYAFGPSESARAGFSWTSMNRPSTPAA